MARMVFGNWASDEPRERKPTHYAPNMHFYCTGRRARFAKHEFTNERLIVTCKVCLRKLKKEGII